MSRPSLSRGEDGECVLESLHPFFVSILLELPQLLDPEQPDAVRERLYPQPSEDPETREEWSRLVHPELFALVASAREVVGRDLSSWSLRIPADHVNAWISALNTARLTLGAAHGVTEEDMQRQEEAQTWDEKRLALIKMDHFALLQDLLIHSVNPPPPQEEEGEEGGYPETDS